MAARTGRGWAYAGAVLGGAVSIAANVAHSYVPPANAGMIWHPQAGAVVGAIFWPLALFVAVEILARTAWPAGKRWSTLRFVGLLPVGLVAAVVSYRHLSGLLGFYREDQLTAAIGPLAVDGLMVMATGALLATGARRSAPAVTEPEPVTPPAPVVELPAPEPEPMPEAMPATEPTAPVKPVAKRATTPKRQPSAAARIAAAIARSPRASDAAIAARLGLSETTVKRHRRQAVDSVSSGSAPKLKAV
ncbi:hypothetical protein ACQP00_42595 [Dactylosporangium sp. CS-047395]|uniref:hypothetical protein n=1 Tax=Dactylosporangium sp. CS-047395 TaxID=3239936 RepID=UPI003D92647F